MPPRMSASLIRTPARMSALSVIKAPALIEVTRSATAATGVATAIRGDHGLATARLATIRFKDDRCGTVPMVRAADLRVLNPALSLKISDLVSKTDDGIERSQVKLPISRSEHPRDDQWLDDPTDANVKWYIPRFRLAASGQQYSIELRSRVIDSGTTVGEGAELAFKLAKFPAAELGEGVNAGKEVPTSIAVRLEYRMLVNGQLGPVAKLDAEEVTPTPEGADVRMTVASLAARDALYAALADPRFAARLVIVRQVEVAIPVASGATSTDWKGVLERVDRAVLFKDVVRAAGSPAPGPADASLIDATRIRSTGIGAGRSSGLAGAASARLVDLRLTADMKAALKSKRPPTQPSKYREVKRSLESRIGVEALDGSVLAFDPALHPYIFTIGAAPSASAGGLTARDEPYQPTPASPRKSFRYYQSGTQANVFYYFPDRFRLGRASNDPRAPLARLRLVALEGQDDLAAIGEFTAIPTVDAERLVSARQALKKFLPPGAADVELMPISLEPSGLKLELKLPGSGPLDELRDVPSALIDLECGASFQVQLTIDQLQRVRDALCGAEQGLLSGRVKASLCAGGAVVETIDVALRVEDAVGDVLDTTESSIDNGAALKVELRGAIESPVNLDRLKAVLVVRSSDAAEGERIISAKIDDLGSPRPGRLSKGQVWSVAIRPDVSLEAGESLVRAEFNESDLTVEPAPDAVWEAIFDRRPPLGVSREITIEAIGGAFDAAAPQPVTDLLVRFRSGEQIRLTAETPKGVVSQRVGVDDLVLGRANELEYEYQVTVVRGSSPPIVGEWIVGRDATLWVTAA